MVPIELGKQYTVEITGMTREGNGAGRIGGFAVFVPSAIPGDVVAAEPVIVKKSYAICRTIDLLSPSPSRVIPRCVHVDDCGACPMMCAKYSEQLKIKRGFIEDCMRRIGGIGDFSLDEIIGMENPYRYRNKSAFPLVRTAAGVRFGCFERESHRVIPIEDCMIAANEDAAICRAVCNFMDKNNIAPFDEESRKGEIRRVMIRKSHTRGSMMAVIAANTGKFKNKDSLCADLVSSCPNLASVVLNICGDKRGFVLGSRSYTLWGSDTIEDSLCGIEFSVSPESFFQINHEQTERLYDTAMRFAQIDGSCRVLDIYCGVGTISLLAAKSAREVIGIEIVGAAVKNARINAARNDIKNARFIAADAAVAVDRLITDGTRSDVVILDPPRKGADKKTLSAVARANPKRIVYVSCDPATLARDTRALHEHGYTVRSAVGVDMFPHTGCMETVCLLSKLHAKEHIEVELNMDELDLTAAESKATYEEIKRYVSEHSGLNVSTLYIAQIKQKYGIIERENYNKPKSGDARQPQCPIGKEKAITEALRYFGMI